MSDILIVDDDASVRTFIKSCLEMVGHQVFRSWDGLEALGVLEAQHIDLVITDLFMPEVSGLELIQEIGSKHPGVRVIAITGFDVREGVDVLELAEQYGAHATLRKPFSTDQIRAAVKDQLQE